MATITSAANGNWSSAATWDGGVVPGDGDFVQVGHAVVVDQDIGSVVGGGVKRIHISGAAASLSVDASAPRTMLFGSTGSNPVGSGTVQNPGSDATMHGFFVPNGHLSLVGTATNPVTVNSADGVSPVYIHRYWGDVDFTGAGSFAGAQLAIKYATLHNLGANSNQYFGIDWELNMGEVNISNVRFVSPFSAFYCRGLRGTGRPQVKIKKVTIEGARGGDCIYFANDENIISPEIEDITETGSAADGFVVKFWGRPKTPIIKRVVTIQQGTYKRSGVIINTAGTNSLAGAVIENVYQHVVDNRYGNCVDIGKSVIAAEADSPVVQKCVAYHALQGFVSNSSPSTGETLRLNQNIAFAHQESSISHSQFISYGGNDQKWNRNVTVIESSGSGQNPFGIFVYNGSDVHVDRHTTAHLGLTNNTETGIYFGNGSGATNACSGTIKNSIVHRCANGIFASRGPENGSAPVVFDDEYGGAGVHHNCVHGTTGKAYDIQYADMAAEPWVSSNFDDGTVRHPDAQYGDVVADPLFIDTTRNPYTYAETLGATGTSAQKAAWLATEFAKVHGIGGVEPAEGVDVETMRQWVMGGFAPTNSALNGTGYEGVDIGAMDYVSPDDTAPNLTDASCTATSPTTATGLVTTDDGNGTLYFLASTNATETATTIKAALSQSVTATGEQTISLSGLDPETTYYLHFVQINGASLESSVVSTAAWATPNVVVKGASLTLYAGTTPQASVTNIVALWWDATTPSGAPAYSTTTASTDASGVLTLDLDATTSLDIGGNGFLLLYKLDATDHRDSLVFAGRVAVSDIG